MVFEFFVIGSLWFWLLLVLTGAVVLAMTESGVAPTRSGWVVVGLLAALWLFGNLKPLEVLAWIAANPTASIGLAVGWFALGTGWSVAKWWFHVQAIRRRAVSLRGEFLRANDLPADGGVPDALARDWERHLYVNGVRLPVRVSDNKARILAWMVWWPVSLVWTLVDDPVRRIFLAIYDRIGGQLQRIADRATADLMPKSARPDDGGR